MRLDLLLLVWGNGRFAWETGNARYRQSTSPIAA